MNTYISVSITEYAAHPSLNTGFFFVDITSCGLNAGHAIAYATAKKHMEELVTKHHFEIECQPNTLDPTIVTYMARGFLD